MTAFANGASGDARVVNRSTGPASDGDDHGRDERS